MINRDKKISIRIVTAHSSRVRFNTRYLLIGLDWVLKNVPTSNSGVHSTHVCLWRTQTHLLEKASIIWRLAFSISQSTTTVNM